MSEITESIQILRFGFDGMRFGMDVTGATVKQIKNLTIFIVGLLHREKLQGKTSLRKMLKKDGSLQVLKIKEEDLKKLKKLLKKYGVLYTVLPDINKGDGMCEILFHTEATPRINEIAEKLGSAKVESLVDYAKNGTDGNYEKIIEEFKKDNLIPKESLEVDRTEMKNISRKINKAAMEKDPNKVCLVINKSIIVETRGEETRVVIPRTKGEKYLKFKNDELILSKSGNSYFLFLDSKKEYPIEDISGKTLNKMPGAEIKRNYFLENEPARIQARKKREKEKFLNNKKNKKEFEGNKNSEKKFSDSKKKQSAKNTHSKSYKPKSSSRSR
ncbi:MAG: PcfB family protein [Lachnospiraceae bacterium]|nr:PcfB family protein [Lachnospiraceae bacterium]